MTVPRLQSAFVSLHRAWPYLTDEDRALAYLRGAVVSGTRSHDVAPADSPSRPGGVPHASWPDRSIPGTLLGAALQALPTRQPEALVLKYYAKWPDAQIAALWVSAAGPSCAIPNAAYPPFARAGYWTDLGQSASKPSALKSWIMSVPGPWSGSGSSAGHDRGSQLYDEPYAVRASSRKATVLTGSRLHGCGSLLHGHERDTTRQRAKLGDAGPRPGPRRCSDRACVRGGDCTQTNACSQVNSPLGLAPMRR
jgi:hypothetical protein